MITDKRFEVLEDSSVKLHISIDSGNVRKEFDEQLASVGKEASIPGFRKGKIPREILERKYGEPIKHQTALKLVEDSIVEALKDSEKGPISQPSLDEIPELDLEKDFSFSVTYDVLPEISVPDISTFTVKKNEPVILDTHENLELDRIREENAVYTVKSDGKVDADSVVTLNYVELDKDNNALEETRRKDFVHSMGKNLGPYNIGENLEGLSKGEKTVLVKAWKNIKSEDQPEYPTEDQSGLKPEDQSERTFRLEVEITEVKTRELPELDDELARDVSEEFNTLDELKKKIREELKNNADSRIKGDLINTITEKMIDSVDIVVPKSMLESDLEQTWEQYVRNSGAEEKDVLEALEKEGKSKKDILEQWKDDARKSVKTRLLYGQVIKDQEIVASNGEIDKELEKRAEQYKISVEELNNIFDGDAFRRSIKAEMIQEKLFDYFLNTVKVENGEKIDYFQLIKA